MSILFFLGKHLGMGLLSDMVSDMLTLQDTIKMFSIMSISFSLPSSFHILTNISVIGLLISVILGDI